MITVLAPSLGPIQGYTTHEQVRLWLRGDLREEMRDHLRDGSRRYFAVAQVRLVGGQWSEPRYQKLMPYFDMTGVIAFTRLTPNSAHEYRAGWIETAPDVDLNSPQLPTAADLDWQGIPAVPFSTGSANPQMARTFIAGSCRYLLKLRMLALDLFDERGDKVFRSILEQNNTLGRPDALLMIGDQIYADDLNAFRPDDTLNQFLDRYHDAFGQEHLRRLMTQVPTYMVLDDHEIEDNWPQKATQKDRMMLYPKAIHAYQIYQASHSPLLELDANGYVDGTPQQFWYKFRDGCVDCFMMDSRTERVWNEDPTKRSMITRAQMTALLEWLEADQAANRIKLVVTSVPFFPDLKEESDDKWCGFIRERTQILDHIKEHQIRNVVFLSGDVHCSFTAELTCEGDQAFKVISVISSSFFWPYPHMRSTNFQLSGALQVPKDHSNEYRVRGDADKIYSDDNFARLQFAPGQLDVAFFDRKGRQLGTAAHTF